MKPWLIASGDEAGKVWMLKPKNQNKNDYGYDSAVIFDINQTYGPATTQTPTDKGITVSTIGMVAVRNQKSGYQKAEIYIPVFEAKEIRVLTFSHKRNATVSCLTQWSR